MGEWGNYVEEGHMISRGLARLSICSPLVLALAIAVTGPSRAGETNFFNESLASDLLQSKAQLRIYRHDDQADLACESRAFVGAEVVRSPRVVNETLNERKWIERWVLDRCGSHVTYDVYFTEVGQGGAIFTFLEVQ